MKEKGGATSRVEPKILPREAWPSADRIGWDDVCRPSVRLKKGGSGSHLNQESLHEYAARYGRFLGFLKRIGRLDMSAPASSQVTPEKVQAYIADFQGKISSVTAWNCIYKVRRAAQLLSPNTDFRWLIEIERDFEALQEPRFKLNRFVYAEQLVKAGLTLMVEAKDFTKAGFKRSRGIRNGLMLALLGLNPMRLKNFASLEIGTTFRQIEGRWWVSLPARTTKTKRSPEERPVVTWLNPYIELYLQEARPVLLTGAEMETKALWISSISRGPMTKQKVGSLVTQITLETCGIAMSPHLFRTADATTAADAQSEMPNLATALLGHADPRIADEHYKQNSSLNAQKDYAEIVRQIYLHQPPG